MSKIYAPVLIPTLNRVKHFQRCLESLAKNHGAEHTDIYISVDYPPSEKYVAGNKRIIEYLKTCRALERFSSATIFYQDHNLGSTGNTLYLQNRIKEKYECYIFTEDDNEFSVWFLEYINCGLMAFKDHPYVISIHGFKDTDWIFDEGVPVTGAKLFAGYGYGAWYSAKEKWDRDIQRFLLDRKRLYPKNIAKLFASNRYLFAMYISSLICSDSGLFWNSENQLALVDTVKSIYMSFTDYYCIVPDKSKVRNWGNDGSGANMLRNTDINPLTKWRIEEDKPVEYDPAEVKYISENDKLAEKYLSQIIGIKALCVSIIRYVLLLFLGLDRERYLRVKKRIRKIAHMCKRNK